MTKTPEEIEALAMAIGADALVKTVLPKLQLPNYTVLEIMKMLAKAKNDYHKSLGIDDFFKAVSEKDA